MSVRVSSWVWQHSPVEHRGDLLVLLALADHAHDDGGSAYPSVSTLARKARLTRRGAQLALRRLEKVDAIERAGIGPRGVITYRVLMPSEGANSVRGEVTTRELSGTGGELSSTKGANSPSPEPSIEPSLEPSARAGARCPLGKDLAITEWATAQSRLRSTINNDIYDVWLARLHAHDFRGDTLVVGAPPQTRSWIADRYGQILHDAAERRVRVVSCEGAA